MGAYMCIASNGVPPTISKRIMVSVHFHPVIQVPNQLVGAPLGTDVSLECYVEAFPVPINYWIRDTGEMVISSDKYEVQVSSRSMFEVRMSVLVRNLQPEDVGSYRCVAKNSVGEVESNIRLYVIPGPTQRVLQPRYDEEDVDQFGSAEQEAEYDNSNTIGGEQKSLRPVSGIETGLKVTPSPSARGTYVSYNENHVPVDPPIGLRPAVSSAPLPYVHSLLIFLLYVLSTV